MIIVTVDNSNSKIEGLNILQYKQLKDKLSYSITEKSHYFAGGYGSRKRTLMDKKGNFPTGLLKETLLYLTNSKLPYQLNDIRRTPLPHNRLFPFVLPYPPYPEQVAAASQIKKPRGIIVAPTGFGKSILIALIIKRLNVNSLIIVPSLELKHQLTQTLKSIFSDELVGPFGHQIAIENIDALDVKADYLMYDCVICDEFHHAAAKTYQELNKKSWNTVFYRFGLTASPYRTNKNEEMLLEAVLAEVIYSVNYDTAVNKGYIVPMEALFIDLPKIKVENTGNWPAIYKELIMDRSDRNRLIIQLTETLSKNNKSTLILVKQIEHGIHLQQLFKTLHHNVMFAHGSDVDSTNMIKLFSEGSITTLIATSIVGEGVDTRAAEYIILAGGTGKSRVSLMQNCGRGFRKFKDKETCKVIVFKEDSHKWFKEHYKHFLKTMKEEYNIIPKQLDFIVDNK